MSEPFQMGYGGTCCHKRGCTNTDPAQCALAAVHAQRLDGCMVAGTCQLSRHCGFYAAHCRRDCAPAEAP